MTTTREAVADSRDQYAFHDDIVYLQETKRGLTRATVEEISGIKGEPAWMLESRLRAYDHFLKRPMPVWTDGLDRIDFDKMARIARLTYETGWRIANLDHMPVRDNLGPRAVAPAGARR